MKSRCAMKKTVLVAVRWLASLGIGLFFAALVVKDWPVEKLFHDSLRLDGLVLHTGAWRVNLLFVPLYFLTLVSMHFFRVWRWRPLLRPMRRVGFWTLNRVCSVGFMAMFLLPFRLGELVRPALISTETPIRRSTALATIVVERTVDGVIVSLALAVALVFLPRHRSGSYLELQVATYLALTLFALVVATLALMFAFRDRLSAWVTAVAPKVSGIRLGRAISGVVQRFLQGLAVLPEVREFLKFLLLSLGYWGSNCVGLYILSLGFDLDIPFVAAVAMMSTIVVGMMIPNAPANLGSFWYFLLKPLELYGIGSRADAVLYAFVVWSLQLLQLLLFGGYYLARGRIEFRRAFRVSLSSLGQEGVSQGVASPSKGETPPLYQDKRGA